ncbi:hypothetical protein [Emticicia agri]|uniref:Uncharacterized protein n=1 Tax=Emticicia agri TaxID=2492393 RepID=A0A4Q5LYN4_9BACT|nr:hypothetical protein [Emticicia agri]RYU95036.1 hypothetical protein EWM59_14225 [Emticicia agri]
MKNQQNLRRIGLLAIVLVVVGIFVISCTGGSAEPPATTKSEGVTVTTTTISQQKSGRTLMLSAEARPYQSVTLYAK